MAGRFSIEAIFKAKDRFTRPIAKIQKRTERMIRSFDRGMDRIRRVSGGVVGSLRKVSIAAGAAGAAVGLAAKHIIGTGSSFEEAITAVGAVGLQTRDQIAALEKRALELGSTTKFTATEAANAMEILARAGMSNQEILSGVGGVLDAAAASGLEMAEVAEVVSATLNGMGLEAAQAGRVADVLSLASARTKSTIGSLGESMKNLAPVARQMGVSLEEAVASAALLQHVGLDASEAGTATATMLTKLSEPAAGVAAKMRELGIAFQDARGDALPLPQILANFEKAANGAGGSMETVAFFADLVGLRGQKAALNLKEMEKSGQMQALVSQLQDAEGSARKMAALRMDNLRGDFTLLGSAVDGVETKLFKTESGALRKLTQGFTRWIEQNGDRIVDLANKAITVGKELAGIFGDEFMGAIKPAIEAFRGMFPDTTDADTWKSTLTVLVRALGRLAGFAVMVGGAFAGLAGVLTVVVTGAINTVLKFLDSLVQMIGKRIFGVVDFFSDLSAIFDAEGLSLGEKMLALGKRIVEGLIDGMKAMAMGPVEIIRNMGKSIIDGFADALDIGSPSRKMRRSGMFTVAGLAGGIETGIPKVRHAADDMIEAVNGASRRLERTTLPAINIAGRYTDGFGPEGRDGPGRQVISQTGALRRDLQETRETYRHELHVVDPGGRTELRKDRRARGAGITLAPSGAF